MKISHALLILIIGCFGCDQKSNESDVYYTPLAPSIVHLKISKGLTDTLYVDVMVQLNIPRKDSRSETLVITEPGDYFLNVKIDRATFGKLNLNGIYKIVLIPNDTTNILVSSSNSKTEVSFTGRVAKINKYYLEKSSSLGYTDIRMPINSFVTPESTFNSLKTNIDSITNQELSFFEKYTLEKELPQWFLNFEEAQIVYMAEFFKTSLPGTNEILGLFNDSLPIDYFSYLEGVKIENPDAILSSHYLWFPDSYFTRNLPIDSFQNHGGLSRISIIQSHELKQSKLELSGVVKDIYHRYNFSSIISHYSDSLAIDSVAREFELVDYYELVKVAGTKKENKLKGLNLNKGDTIPDFYTVNLLDSLVSVREYRNEILYLNFWATWCAPCIKNFPELNTLITQHHGDARIRIINICIGSKKENWMRVVERYDLRGTNLFAEGNWSSKLESYFNITGIPHYVIVNRDNVLYENFSDKAPMVQPKLDELLRNITMHK